MYKYKYRWYTLHIKVFQADFLIDFHVMTRLDWNELVNKPGHLLSWFHSASVGEVWKVNCLKFQQKWHCFQSGKIHKKHKQNIWKIVKTVGDLVLPLQTILGSHIAVNNWWAVQKLLYLVSTFWKNFCRRKWLVVLTYIRCGYKVPEMILLKGTM